MSQLTTHVLDTVSGHPAQGLRYCLYRLSGSGERELLVDAKTNADGRSNAPLLTGEDFVNGTYEIEFHVGPYFNNGDEWTESRAFLDVVPVRFSITDDRHYHVPLLVSPFAYSTYRGS